MRVQTTVEASGTELMDVRFVSGEAYEVAVRGHRVLVDQPAYVGGEDSAPTPTELFVASLATCVGFYAGRYLTRHGFSPSLPRKRLRCSMLRSRGFHSSTASPIHCRNSTGHE